MSLIIEVLLVKTVNITLNEGNWQRICLAAVFYLSNRSFVL